MAIKFDCKEAGCEEEVVYIRKVLTGEMTLEQNKASETDIPGWYTVYLMCGGGHLHPYSVKRSLFFE
jgi:hypothetical protein